MAKLLVTIFKFFVFCCCFYVVGLLLIGSVVPNLLTPNLNSDIGIGNTLLRLEEAQDQEDIDFLILGSSHAYRGFDTRIFRESGFMTFNLGTSSQTPMQTFYLLEKYLEHMDPKFIIFEVYPGVFEVDGVESILDLLATADIDSDLVDEVFSLNDIKAYNTLIFSSIKRSIGFKRKHNSEILNPDEVYVKGGYVEKANQKLNPKKLRKQRRWKLKGKQIEYLERIIDFVKPRELVFVQAPITKNLYDSYSNNHEIDSLFNSKGLYFNFNQKRFLIDSLHFYDAHHLNQDGVELFNFRLIKEMKMIHIFDDL